MLAIASRKEILSYSQIKKIVKVVKNTLNHWPRNYSLSEERIKNCRKGGKKQAAIERKFRSRYR